MKQINRYIKRHIGMFLTAVFFLCIETFAELLQPTFMAHVVDEGVKGQDIKRILGYGVIMVSIALVGGVAAVLRNLFASRTSQIIGKELRGDLYRKVQTLSFENIDKIQTSSIITRITNDVTQIQNFINGIMRMMIKVPITCVGAVVLIILQTPRQLPVIAVIFLISGVLIVANMKLGYPRFGKLQKKLDKLNGVSREFLASIRVVKAFNAEKQEAQKFYEASEEFSNAGISAARVLAVFSPLINLTVNLGIIALLWISQSQDAGQIGRLMASVNYMTQVLFAIGRISFILNSAVRAVASSDRVLEIMQEEPAQKLPAKPVSFDVKGEVVFNNVFFSYIHAGRPAVENLNFTILAGETIGIIGPTGSGKTTLINLVPRLYDATDGQVLVDGRMLPK